MKENKLDRLMISIFFSLQGSLNSLQISILVYPLCIVEQGVIKIEILAIKTYKHSRLLLHWQKVCVHSNLKCFFSYAD
jgi:hypothetical protein